MQRILGTLLLIILITACEEQEITLKEGPWTGKFQAMDNREIPFDFALQKEAGKFIATFTNADEKVVSDEIEIEGDSIIMRMPAFEGYFKGTYDETGMQGLFVKEAEEKEVSFTAMAGEAPRFGKDAPARVEVGGRWETYFSPDTEDSNPAIGIFDQEGDQLTGTFRTTKGDYRYLEGRVSGDSLFLSTFDGAHLFLFEAVVKDSVMQGSFYSGDHFKEPFSAVRNPEFELQDEDDITLLKEGYETISFSFPDETGKEVSLEDERFKDKVVLVQLMGSWCPNCLDETRYLVDYLDAHENKDVEVVALAFEYAKTPERAFANIARLKERIGVEYPVLLAQYGTSSKEDALDKLPMLNTVWSYPTLIFIGRDGKVKGIHTGFNGPATGEKFDQFKSMFTAKVDSLLAEN